MRLSLTAIRLALALFCLVLLPNVSAAQYRPDEVADKAFQSRVLAIGNDVAKAFPSAWNNAHKAGEPQGSEFVRRWALSLRANGILACVNGKRGGDTLSQDVLDFPLTQDGALDTSGRFTGRIAIVDVIGGAGGPNPSLVFGDVSEFAPGKCIEPFLESSEADNVPPPGPGQPPPVVSPPPPTVDLSRVLADLAELRASTARVEDVAGRAVSGSESAYTLIAEQLIAVHISAIYERLERLQVALDAVAERVTKISNARILRY